MRTETIEVFTFDELSEPAKEQARNWYRSDGDLWHWADEWWNSAVAFSAIAPIDIRGVHWDNADPDMRWSGDDALRELSGARAWKWLHNNGWFDLAAKNVMGDCTLTGYCGDCEFFDPIEKYRRDPAGVPDLKTLFRDCVHSWAFAARRDMEWSYSDEAVDETIRCNQYEFDDLGRLWIWG
jgi:hypothetical protein